MLIHAVQTYLSVRQATGFHLKQVGRHLRRFAAYSDAKGQSYVDCQTAIEWARQASSVEQRARRLGDVIRLARYLRAEDARHEIPPAVFGRERRVRRPVASNQTYIPTRAEAQLRPNDTDGYKRLT